MDLGEGGPAFTYEEIARMIDHSLLNPILTDRDLEEGCEIALKYGVAGVCVLPYFLPRCVEILEDGPVAPGTTVGFPHGGHSTAAKVAEAEYALDEGAEELDMVVNISKVLSEDWEYVREEIRAVTEAVHDRNRKIKVIFETCYLDTDQKVKLCEICGELNVDWVKTSTGFGTAGATMDDVRLLRRHSPPEVQVKAAGGIRDMK